MLVPKMANKSPAEHPTLLLSSMNAPNFSFESHESVSSNQDNIGSNTCPQTEKVVQAQTNQVVNKRKRTSSSISNDIVVNEKKEFLENNAKIELNENDDKTKETEDDAVKLCPVCGDTASSHTHYGGRSCASCRAFFRRSVIKQSR